MTEQAMPPPYPADTRAKGWRFEIDTEAVKASDTWLLAKRGDVKGALLLLWSEAWQQTPCGSLPNDDELIALIIDMPLPTFTKHRRVLMRGWLLAGDGRLYHSTITCRVLAMLAKREKDARRTAERRARIAGPATDPVTTHAEVSAVSHVTDTGLSSEFDTKHQAPSTIEKETTSSSSLPTIPCPYQSIVDLFHEKLPDLPRIRVMTKPREAAMRKRWGWVLSSKKSDGSRRATNASEALAWLGDYFARAAVNDFLMGRTQRSAEHAGWKCDIEYLLSDRGLTQVIEKTQDAA